MESELGDASASAENIALNSQTFTIFSDLNTPHHGTPSLQTDCTQVKLRGQMCVDCERLGAYLPQPSYFFFFTGTPLEVAAFVLVAGFLDVAAFLPVSASVVFFWKVSKMTSSRVLVSVTFPSPLVTDGAV